MFRGLTISFEWLLECRGMCLLEVEDCDCDVYEYGMPDDFLSVGLSHEELSSGINDIS